jgi:hypothetical protein
MRPLDLTLSEAVEEFFHREADSYSEPRSQELAARIRELAQTCQCHRLRPRRSGNWVRRPIPTPNCLVTPLKEYSLFSLLSSRRLIRKQNYKKDLTTFPVSGTLSLV